MLCCLRPCRCVAERVVERASASASLMDMHSQSKGLTVVDDAMNASHHSRLPRPVRSVSVDPNALRAIVTLAASQRTVLEQNLKVPRKAMHHLSSFHVGCIVSQLLRAGLDAALRDPAAFIGKVQQHSTEGVSLSTVGVLGAVHRIFCLQGCAFRLVQLFLLLLLL